MVIKDWKSFESGNLKGYFRLITSEGFEIKGMKCQVPTNYNTRYELTSTSNASYTRNITDGTNESTYQNWDGNFRGDKATFARDNVNRKKVWTDNPAWIFYDLSTNKKNPGLPYCELDEKQSTITDDWLAISANSKNQLTLNLITNLKQL